MTIPHVLKHARNAMTDHRSRSFCEYAAYTLVILLIAASKNEADDLSIVYCIC